MEGQLPASSFRFGTRFTHRITRSDWVSFLRTYWRSALEDREAGGRLASTAPGRPTVGPWYKCAVTTCDPTSRESSGP